MPENTKKQNWLLRAVGIASAVVMFISGTIGLYFTVESRVKDAMAENTKHLTLEIKRSAVDLASMHRDDLEFRVLIKKREIAALRRAGNPVPERLEIELGALQDQLEEVKEKWPIVQ